MATEWAAMKPRERDAWVHVEVFDAPQPSGRHAPKWGERCPTHLMLECCGRLGCPQYTTDASADYLVLENARTWKQAVRQKFNDALSMVHYEHDRRGTEPLCETYRIGDWSHAAYLALTHSP